MRNLAIRGAVGTRAVPSVALAGCGEISFAGMTGSSSAVIAGVAGFLIGDGYDAMRVPSDIATESGVRPAGEACWKEENNADNAEPAARFLQIIKETRAGWLNDDAQERLSGLSG